jgi:hypothetical protein
MIEEFKEGSPFPRLLPAGGGERGTRRRWGDSASMEQPESYSLMLTEDERRV